jgi:putative ABC transport system permease protein
VEVGATIENVRFMNSNVQPPRWALKFLKFICPDHLFEEIEGDLIQKFNRDVKAVGEKKAKMRLMWNVIRFFRLGILLRNKFSIELNQSYMIRNYFLVLIRGITKRKFYTAINILCLTLGITFALLLGVFVHQELQVNKSLKDVDRLFLVQTQTKSTDDYNFFVPSRLAKQCLEQYPLLFESSFRFFDRNVTVSKDDKHFRLQSMIGDASFINMFGFEVLTGDGATALKNPNSLIITKKVANQFFNRWDVVGETLSVSTEQNGRKDYTIKAVIEDPEDKNSITDFMNMDAQIFLPLENYRDFFPLFNQDSWNDLIITHLKLAPSASVMEAESTINQLVDKNISSKDSEIKIYRLSPISNYYQVTNHSAVQKLITSLIAILVLILLLAISNFINISIASSFSRSREVGVRKVLGGLSKQVVSQFIMESFVFALASAVFALLAYQLVYPSFGELLGTKMPSVISFQGTFWIVIIIAIIFIGLLAGIYPAIFQSMAKPIESLKGKSKSVKGTIQFSRTLIAFQFLITIFILTATIILSSQTSYFLNKDLGYDKSHVLIVNSVPRLWTEAGFQKMESAKKEFSLSPNVQSVSLSMGAPGWNFSPGGGTLYKAENSSANGVGYTVTGADENFFRVYNLKLTDGSLFDNSNNRKPNEVVINRTAQMALSIKVGDQLKASNFGDAVLTVKGVVDDFHFASLHEKVAPLMIVHNIDFEAYRFFSFKMKPGKMSESVNEVQALWKKVFPEDAFEFSFADERLKQLYITELQMKKASMFATILMLVIVVTGVLGLVSLSVAKRTKEIGIRKVLGASVRTILTLLAIEYILLMIVSIFIGVPLSYFLANQWLASFAYHIELNWWMFALPIVCFFVVIILIVCAQSLKTALDNPVNSLKYE